MSVYLICMTFLIEIRHKHHFYVRGNILLDPLRTAPFQGRVWLPHRKLPRFGAGFGRYPDECSSGISSSRISSSAFLRPHLFVSAFIRRANIRLAFLRIRKNSLSKYSYPQNFVLANLRKAKIRPRKYSYAEYSSANLRPQNFVRKSSSAILRRQKFVGRSSSANLRPQMFVYKSSSANLRPQKFVGTSSSAILRL